MIDFPFANSLAHHRTYGDGVKSVLVLVKHFLREIGFNTGLDSSQRVRLVTELARFKQQGISIQNPSNSITMHRKEAEEMCYAFLRY